MLSIQIFSFKYEDRINLADDIAILRLPEILLMRAEALARINGLNQESLDQLNAVRSRSLRIFDSDQGTVSNELVLFKLDDFAHTDELLQAIIRERYVELHFEGNRYRDLMRLRRNLRAFSFDDPRLQWPIPQSEIDVNPNLVQNRAYK